MSRNLVWDGQRPSVLFLGNAPAPVTAEVAFFPEEFQDPDPVILQIPETGEPLIDRDGIGISLPDWIFGEGEDVRA